MRTFPRARGRRRIAAATLAVMTVGGLAVPVLEPTALPWASAGTAQKHGDKPGKLKQRQSQVQEDIKAAGHDLDESSAQLAQATTRLTAANKTLDAAEARLATARAALARAEQAVATAKAEDARMQAALEAAQARLAQARGDLATGQKAVDDHRRRVRDSFADMVENGDPRLLAVATLMNASTPEELARQQEFNDTVLASQSAQYQSLRSAEVLLKVRAQQVKEATDEVAVQRKAAADHLVVMQGLEREATTARDAVARNVSTAARARGAARVAAVAAARAKDHDLRMLQALKRQEARIKQRILALTRHDRNRNVGAVDGLFLDPVANSYITSPYGWRKHPIYGYWGLHDGDDFHAPCGVPLRAVETGRVLDEYYSSVWGNRLYLSLGKINGHNYTVIYNHISKYRVGAGATVARGDVVAYAGTTGWSTACHLHFTVLKDGNPVDPQTVL